MEIPTNWLATSPNSSNFVETSKNEISTLFIAFENNFFRKFLFESSKLVKFSQIAVIKWAEEKWMKYSKQ